MNLNLIKVKTLLKNLLFPKNKTGWCLVGEYEGKRGCIEVSSTDMLKRSSVP